MNRDDIIRMARQVGYPINHPDWAKAAEEFAAIIADRAAAAEREACAKVCEQWDASHPQRIADAIRARGQA